MAHSSAPFSTKPGPGLIAVAHAAMLVGFLSWRFGGMDPIGRDGAAWLGAIAPLVTLYAWGRADRSLRRDFLRIAIPLLLLLLVVGVSAFNPHMRLLLADGAPLALAPRDYNHLLPSSAWPEQTVRDFLLNAGLVLTGLNLILARPDRSHQRLLLAVLAANAGVLACIGSFFKLSHASTILGTFPSPNANFFATFFYYNHWGAFALLGVAAAAAVAFDHGRRSPGWDWLQTPAPLFVVVALLLLLSLPISGARASMIAGLALAAVLAFRMVAGFRGGALAAIAVILVIVGGGWWFGRERFNFMLTKTSQQITGLQSGESVDARLPIYRETWKLFRARPIYGWGWQGFRFAFRQNQNFDIRLHNEQKEKTYVIDAHNDWLQLLAELGLVGVALAVATTVGIARLSSARCWRISPSFELLAGFAAVSLLACIDFPFACPAVVAMAWTLLATAAGIARDRRRGSGHS